LQALHLDGWKAFEFKEIECTFGPEEDQEDGLHTVTGENSQMGSGLDIL
jgi:hypothetical protein